MMVYHRRSIVGAILWSRYALFAGHPSRSLSDVYAHHLESPGTQAFTEKEARELVSDFSSVTVRTVLSIGDLLEGAAGQRHAGALLDLSRRLWPRWFIRRFLSRYGLFLMIEAEK